MKVFSEVSEHSGNASQEEQDGRTSHRTASYLNLHKDRAPHLLATLPRMTAAEENRRRDHGTSQRPRAAKAAGTHRHPGALHALDRCNTGGMPAPDTQSPANCYTLPVPGREGLAGEY